MTEETLTADPEELFLDFFKSDKYRERLSVMAVSGKKSFRVDFDDRNESVGKKIRQAEVEWIPYVIIVGKKEQDNQEISVRKRLIGKPFGPKKATVEQFNNLKLTKLLEMLEDETKNFPKYKLPVPLRKFSTKVYFRK